MKQAINLAIRAKSHDDVPIGAVIVRDGQIIARGENRVQKCKNPILHAEIVAINRACKKLGTKILDDCDIYVTLEPRFHWHEYAAYITQPRTKRAVASPTTQKYMKQTGTCGAQL